MWFLAISLMKTTNRMGPSTEHCGKRLGVALVIWDCLLMSDASLIPFTDTEQTSRDIRTLITKNNR